MESESGTIRVNMDTPGKVDPEEDAELATTINPGPILDSLLDSPPPPANTPVEPELKASNSGVELKRSPGPEISTSPDTPEDFKSENVKDEPMETDSLDKSGFP